MILIVPWRTGNNNCLLLIILTIEYNIQNRTKCETDMLKMWQINSIIQKIHFYCSFSIIQIYIFFFYAHKDDIPKKWHCVSIKPAG